LKQSKKLEKPEKIENEEEEKVQLMNVEHFVKFLCKRLKEINTKLICSLVADLWDSTQEQAAKRKAIIGVYNKVCVIQEKGGMDNPQIGGVKTPGGVFIHLMKLEFPEMINLRKIKKSQMEQNKLMQMIGNIQINDD
jgi:hypothetical protein